MSFEDDAPAPQEVRLRGGTANRGRIVRVGDTVRRPLRASSPATRALLEHLARNGFDGAPRWIGVDDVGRETLTFIPGSAPYTPYPEWALTDAALSSVAQLLRRFHDAVAGFDADAWQWHRDVPAPFCSPFASHNDPNLDNVVFRDGRAVALIDFDLAGSGSRVWDLASAARLWCPLRADSDVHDVRQGRGLHRLRLFLEAYDAGAAEREGFVDAALASHSWAYDHVQREVEHGHPAFAHHWIDEHARERAARTLTWLHAHTDTLARAAGAR
jgi:hypothetical protein